MKIAFAYREFILDFKSEAEAKRHIARKVEGKGFWVSEIKPIPDADMNDPEAYKFTITVRKPLFDYNPGW